MREKRYRNQLRSQIQAARATSQAAIREEIAVGSPAAAPEGLMAATAVDLETSPASNVLLKRAERLREDVAFDRSRPVDERLDSLKRLAINLCNNKRATLRLIRLVGTRDEDPALRLAAHDAIKAAAFSSRTVDSWRPVFLSELRKVVEKESGHLVSVALHTLAQYKDGWALNKLEEGLRNPKVAKVKPLRAVQYLAYDDHASHFDVLRDLASRNRSREVRIAAINGLAADPKAEEVLKGVLQSNTEDATVRRAALLSLRQASPSAYSTEVARVVNDEGEDESLRAAGITALGVDAGADGSLKAEISKVHNDTKSELLRSLAKNYLDRA
jgi:hypothetical protein